MNWRLRSNFQRPVDGYLFIPKGNVYVTRHCRDLTKQSNLPLYVVQHGRSRETLGIDCPEWILDAVRMDAEASAKKRQHAVDVKDQRDRKESRALLQRLFPYMPETSLATILDHGFEKRSGRVGRTKTLDEVTKANLAVNAHIRHNYTTYDSFYSTMKTNDDKRNIRARARMAVNDQVNRIARSWRLGDLDAKRVNHNMFIKPSKPLPDTVTTIIDRMEADAPYGSSDADAPMEDIAHITALSLFNDSQDLPQSTKSSVQKRQRVRHSRKSQRPHRQVTTGAVQKTLKQVRTPPTRIQPKRGAAALDKALASLGLNEALPST